ncbi:MAG: hypothetical protein LWW86_09605 [Micrococcales bacterium]|nr:hypothetical protein [Micrococcales bacterium]
MQRWWRQDPRAALIGVLALQLALAAASIASNVGDGSDSGAASHGIWTALTAALLWGIWASRSGLARGILTALIALPLLMLLAFTLGPLDNLLVPLLIAFSVGQLVMLWAPAVTEHVRKRVDIDTY